MDNDFASTTAVALYMLAGVIMGVCQGLAFAQYLIEIGLWG